MQFLEKQPGVTNIDKSIKPGTSKLVFVLDKDKLAENSLTVEQLSLWLRTYASGYNLDELRFGNEKDKQDVVFRVSSDTQTAADLGRVSIPLPASTPGGEGSSVPLISLGEIKLATNPTTITREKGKRTLTVTGSVVVGYNATEINQKLTKFADGDLNLAEGYTWQTGGANEENEKSVQSILQAMLISFILILITMVIEFRSFRQTFIALMIIPLSVAGVLYIFALTGTPLGFPSLIGILALFGIVVTHAIVVIEKINDNIHHGMELKDAIVDAAGNRLEPVLLTSAATILGLVPITISDPFWRGLGGAIIAGLLFSGAIKLFFVPVTYYLMFKNGPKGKK
jgi:multidrug efflux pump subunit AcrB